MTSHSISSQKAQARREQETLFQELLEVLDTLDQAQAHWQTAAASYRESPASPPAASSGPLGWLQRLFSPSSPVAPADPQMQEVIESGQEGIELIRQTLMDVLRRRQVEPIPVLEKSFDPKTMFAVDRQPNANYPAMTVIQEVVRGYRWGDRVLREAQVIVVAPEEENSTADSLDKRTK